MTRAHTRTHSTHTHGDIARYTAAVSEQNEYRLLT